MALSRIELEQIQQHREFLDQYTAAESAALAPVGVDVQDTLNHVFSAVKRILRGEASGVGAWTDVPAASLFTLNDASGILRDDQDQINSFIGRADGESQPTYSSINYVTQNGDLEQAIGELDAAVALAVAGSGDTWQLHFNQGSGLLTVGGAASDGEISFIDDGKWTFNINNPGFDTVFSSSGVQMRALGQRLVEFIGTQIDPGDTVTIPQSASYTPDAQGRNLRVYHNGQLLQPGSGVTVTDENFNDYREVDSTSFVTNVKIKTDAVIQYHING